MTPAFAGDSAAAHVFRGRPPGYSAGEVGADTEARNPLPVKSSQRLEYAQLAQVLGQRGLIDPQRLHLALQTGTASKMPFPEILVGDNLISDWELSRVVCDLYNLPFLPVDIHPPSPQVLEGLDREFLRAHRLIPVDRNGLLLTVCMPGMVPAEVLGQLAAESDSHIAVVVGTVMTNNRWFDEHMPADAPAPLPGVEPSAAPESSSTWSNLFDEADASVLEALTGEGLTLQVEPPEPPTEE